MEKSNIVTLYFKDVIQGKLLFHKSKDEIDKLMHDFENKWPGTRSMWDMKVTVEESDEEECKHMVRIKYDDDFFNFIRFCIRMEFEPFNKFNLGLFNAKFYLAHVPSLTAFNK
jgi:hypothetical protein